MTSQRVFTKSIFMGLLLLFAILSGSKPLVAATETDGVVRSERPAVEVVFVLDTTSSMGGLIAAAKEKIWAIANTLASADPAPNIKMGLVGYRDRGDLYVTALTPLSDDLDAVYVSLMRFEAQGGGDTPESVNQALYEAVTKTHWSPGSSVYRVIFLVGDAPPQMHYQNDVKYSRSCQLAAQKDIIINTIQCGSMTETTPIWRDIARQGRGDYFQVAQSGNAVLYDTPYDKKIADLSRALDNTRVYYGSAEDMRHMEARKEAADAIYETAKPSAVAKRTIFNTKAAGAKNFVGSQELVQAVASGALKLSEVPKDQLPPAMQGLNHIEIEKLVASKGEERRKLQVQIDELAQARQAFIEAKVKEAGTAKADSLDSRIYACIKSQAARKDIFYTQGPAY
jgi:Mg-chelatase subunit ChlD